jgi:hypothetical protein
MLTEDLGTSYQLTYILWRGKPAWPFRRTSVYHHHMPQFDLFIIIHPNTDGILNARISEFLEGCRLNDATAASGARTLPPLSPQDVLSEVPHSPYLLVLSSFLGNWRWFLWHLRDEFGQAVGCSCRIQLIEAADGNRSATRSHCAIKLEPLTLPNNLET